MSDPTASQQHSELDPGRWERVKDAFFTASTLDSQARKAYLKDALGEDTSLHAEVASLLEAHAVQDAVLDRPATDYLPEGALDPGDRWIGRRLGAYELEAQIGRGGMGEVYRARRADAQFHKAVAIKLVRFGYDTQFVLERFKAERQILANLEHPGIARLLDGGAAPDGLPYLVMELVEGEPIDQYCESRGLSIAQRLRLFREVCAAVSYAHQRLVVHRDLKPSNILITADGSVKLLDFGIAKLLYSGAPEGSAESPMTAITALTPAFSSPEQLRGLPVTTTSDVFSLGVILFHLLTGRSPYRAARGSTQATMQEVCETEPVRPSAAVAEAETREKSRPVPARELDDITLKALRKEPDKRYASVEQLSADVDRFLTGRPVLAHGGRVSYHAGKFIRRHKVEIAGAVAVVLTLVGGIVFTTREARVAQRQQVRAERDFDRVRKLADSLLFEMHDAIKDLPGSTAARGLLTQRALEYLDDLSTEAGENDAVRRDLAVAYRKVGEIQGSYGGQSNVNAGAALQSFRKSVAQLETIRARRPGDPDIIVQLDQSLSALGMSLFLSGDLTGAIATSRRAVEVAGTALSRSPASLQRAHDLSLAESYYCVVLDAAAQFEAAIEACRRNVALQERVAAAQPQDTREQRALGVAYDRTADSLDHRYAQTKLNPESEDEALALRRKAMAIDQRLVDADPNSELAKRDLFADDVNMAETLAGRNDLRAAIGYYNKSLLLLDGLSARDPANAELRIYRMQVQRDLSEMYIRLKQPDAALAAVSAASEVISGFSPDQVNVFVRNERAAVMLALAKIHGLRASLPQSTPRTQLREWRLAEGGFADAIKRYDELRAQAALLSPYQSDPSEAADGLNQSREAIQRLTSAAAARR